MIPDPLHELENQVREMNAYMHEHNRTVFGRYPLLFALLGTFGVAAVIYGFEDLLDQVTLFHDHPTAALLVGVVILIFTGSLYKRIERKFD